MGSFELSRRFAAAAIIVAAASASAAAAESRGRYADAPVATSSGWLLTTADGQRYLIPVKVYQAASSIFSRISAGDVLILTHDGADPPRVSQVRLAGGVAPAGARRITIRGRFERYQEQSHQLVLQDGTQYPIDPKLISDGKFMRQIYFRKKGDPVEFLLENGHVVELAVGSGSSDSQETPEVTRLLEHSQAGDRIEIRRRSDSDFRRYILKAVGLSELTLSPELPGQPGQFRGTIRIERSSIFAVKNQAAQQRLLEAGIELEVAGGGLSDAFSRQGIQKGDIIGIGFETGQLVELAEGRYALRVWRNGFWSDSLSEGARVDVEEVRTGVWLTAIQQIPIESDRGSGNLELRVSRARERKLGGLRFRVEMSHDLPELILVNLALRFHLGGAAMTAEDKGNKVELKPLPLPLFGEQPFTFEHEITDPSFLDGRVDVVLTDRSRVLADRPEAQPFIIKALTSLKEPEALAPVYRVAGRNGDPLILRYLITRTLNERDADKRAALVAGLAGARDAVANLLLDDLFGLDRNVEIVRPSRDGLETVPLPKSLRPIPYKLKMIELLGEPGLGEALAGPAGARLFRLYRERDDFAEAIAKVFTRRSSEAISTLLGIATDLPANASDDQRVQAERAATLLSVLGQAIFEPLMLEMRRREIDPTRWQREMAEQQRHPQEIVKQVLNELIAQSFRKRRARLDKQIQQARQRLAGGELAEGLAAIRAVLKEEPSHGPAKGLLPQALIELATAKTSDGARGEAALLYEEALELLDDGERANAAGPLASIIVAGAAEAVDAVPVRSVPHTGGVMLRPGNDGEPLKGAVEEVSGWLTFDLGDGKKGYVRKVFARQAGPGQWAVKPGATSFATVQEELERAKALSPGATADAEVVFGQLNAREGKALYDKGDYQNALHHMDEAIKRVPDDPRVKLRFRCWLHANFGVILAVVVVLICAVGFFLLQIFSKQKKVKFEGEFKHYGADRSARERELGYED